MRQHLGREDAQLLIRCGSLWLDGKRVTRDFEVSRGKTLTLTLSKNSTHAFLWDDSLLIFENKDFLVVYKPSGIPVAPTRDSLVHNLTYAVQSHLKDPYQTIALTRLDVEVRGAVIFAKNARTHAALSELIRKHRIGKSYIALLESSNFPVSGVISDPLSFGKKAVIDPKGKGSVTRFRIIAKCMDGIFYRVIPLTGRRHQIRVHLSNKLSPIIGDRLYGSKKKTIGIALMAQSYTFRLNRVFYRIRVENAMDRLIREVFRLDFIDRTG